MKTHKVTDPLDTLLKEVFLEDAFTGSLSDDDSCFRHILMSEPFEEMPQHKKAEMLNRLRQVLMPASLGQLIQEEISRADLPAAAITAKTGLSATLLEDIRQDKVYPNSVPILLFQRLIELLDVPLTLVKQGIRQTYKLLQVQPFQAFSGGATPAFKKGNYLSRDVVSRVTHANEGKELFQNEEALERYINRLEELMNG